MKRFDEYLQREVEIQEDITPEIGKEIKLEEPKEFKEVLAEDKQ